MLLCSCYSCIQIVLLDKPAGRLRWTSEMETNLFNIINSLDEGKFAGLLSRPKKQQSTRSKELGLYWSMVHTILNAGTQDSGVFVPYKKMKQKYWR